MMPGFRLFWTPRVFGGVSDICPRRLRGNRQVLVLPKVLIVWTPRVFWPSEW